MQPLPESPVEAGKDMHDPTREDASSDQLSASEMLGDWEAWWRLGISVLARRTAQRLALR
ncbi:MAG: hypothetical protein A4S14_06775 [Proteobacteria bacterium SG_bin9]|nr:MAG: hypothetical protein A4S14_06775 [Proteobacteria bacterium SG_bin9]